MLLSTTVPITSMKEQTITSIDRTFFFTNTNYDRLYQLPSSDIANTYTNEMALYQQLLELKQYCSNNSW